MNKQYTLKTNNRFFTTQKSFVEHLKSIRVFGENNNGKIDNEEYVNDLIDYIQDYHNDSVQIQREYDLDHCEFFVDFPTMRWKGRQTEKCIWIRDISNSSKLREIGINPRAFCNQPMPEQNFRSLCNVIIRNLKYEIRKREADKNGKSVSEVNLWHKFPTTKQIIDEFISIHNLEDKLEQVISSNGLGNNVPYLLDDYKYLENEFLNFYCQKHGIRYELKDRK